MPPEPAGVANFMGLLAARQGKGPFAPTARLAGTISIMRPFPPPRDFGAWDTLPEFPDENELDLSNPDVKDALARRDVLVGEWKQYLDYPHGVWSEDCIRDFPHFAEQWRNWLLRRSWEGIAFINANMRRWSAQSPGNA